MNLFEFIENGENPPFKIQIKLKKQHLAYCAIELLEDFNPITQATINIVETNSQNKSGKNEEKYYYLKTRKILKKLFYLHICIAI